ncbi:histidine phosphatase family protein [Solibacillus sp. FSL W8-0372]|uniref:histidine phosphatase family protein n=1 Tax=Solibacillus sp. FSL W8-0372 TaxID=2921713 RepID=UPI0030CCA5B3
MKLYIIRHCEAEGQAPEAMLTAAGMEARKRLASFLIPYQIEQVISSPYKRAIQTIETFVQDNGSPFKVDERLKERILSSENLVDWLEKLQQTYIDQDLKFDGGESSNEAVNRMIELVNELRQGNNSSVAIVTHGNIMSLLINHYNGAFGFHEWKQLSNPDVYEIDFNSKDIKANRIWGNEIEFI